MTSALFMPPATASVALVEQESVDPALGSVQSARAVVPPDDGEGSPKKAMILSSVPPPTFDAVKPLAPLAAPSPTTMPTEVAAPASVAIPETVAAPEAVAVSAMASGVYMTVGGVLAEVNDTPIYAHTVLALLDKELSARARDMDAETFRRFALGRIARQTQELIRDELDYTTAAKTLTKEDQAWVNAIATESEQAKVKQAGGSRELAKRRAAEEGYDFDELVRRDYRRIVVSVYQRKQIDPHVQVSAQDMREFYAANGAKLYGDKDRLQFRVIEIDPARMGGKDPRAAAEAKINAIRAKAVAGQEFAALASTENHDDALRASGGDPGGWMDRGCYRVDAVEAALWQLSPGGVTPVVEDGGVFYVAKLEDKHVGRTRPFDDPTVQDDVLKRLTQQQMSALWDRVRDDAYADAMLSAPDDRMQIALEMVMQKYARWSAR